MSDTLKRLEKIEWELAAADDADMLDCRIEFYDIEPDETLKRLPNPMARHATTGQPGE